VGQQLDQERLQKCMAMIESDPETAYEQAKAWQNETHAPEAARCAALAMVGRGEPGVGAKQLEQLATGKSAADDASRADMLVEAGNAWILAREAQRAVADFDAAIKMAPRSPDTLIDRARAYALAGAWNKSEQDLSAALDIRPKDAYALALRAKARLE